MATSEKIADTTEPPRNDPRISRTSPDYCLKFRKRNGRYHLHEDDSKLRNSLLAAVGFFELANAGDFAANVWNSIPIPPYAIALMAVGGSFALFMVYFAYRDARLSWENLKGLRRERRYLRQALQNQQEEQQQPQRQPTENMEDITRIVNAFLDVNHREMGTEIIDRLAMDILMGFGSTLVGLGTFLAIDGANPSVFLASNLMSGYIGNVPLAIFGLVNAGWAIYVWLRARRHGLAYGAGQTPQVDSDSTVGKLLKARIDTVRVHSALNGITGLVAGAASLVTSTMWWGYVVLIPCIIISVVVNYLWRHGMGYERPLIVERLPNFDQEFLTEELVYIASVRRVFLSSKKSSPELLSAVVPDPQSVSDVIDFIVRNDIFEAFCFRLLNDGELSATLFDLSVTPVAIYPHALCNIPEESLRGRVLALAQECIRDLGHAQLKYRERYLLETLGCYMTTSGVVQTSVKNTV